jgi:sulfur carrier protein
MNIVFNGEPLELSAHTTLADVMRRLETPPEDSATAINGEFVPRSQRAEHLLAQGDQITTFEVIVGG